MPSNASTSSPAARSDWASERQETPDLPGFLADRVAEQQRIAGANGVQIIAEPTIALKALSHTNATFTHHDIAKFLHTRTDNADQFQQAYLKVTTSPDLVPLGLDDQGRQRFTTRDMLSAERSLLENADAIGAARRPRRRPQTPHGGPHPAPLERRARARRGRSDEPAAISRPSSASPAPARAPRSPRCARSGKGRATRSKAPRLPESPPRISRSPPASTSRTLASYELAWNNGRDPLTRRDVLVIDEAGMIGTKQLERVLAVAEKAHAKVVLVGDPEQLQAIEAGAPFRGITAAHGVSNLTEVRRQKNQWQRDATAALATGKTADALHAYDQQGGIVAVEKREEARNALLARWARDAKHEPEPITIDPGLHPRRSAGAQHRGPHAPPAIRPARERTEVIPTEHGKQPFAVNDRIRFGRNEKTLGVKNGSLGTVERIEHGVLQIKLDGEAGTRVAVDTKFYKHLDYGYATTVHKAQGTTVDRTYVLATPHFDRHTSYVALSRHREAATRLLRERDFGGRAPGATAEQSKPASPTRCPVRDRRNSPTITSSASQPTPERSQTSSPAAPRRSARGSAISSRHRWTTSPPASSKPPNAGRRVNKKRPKQGRAPSAICPTASRPNPPISATRHPNSVGKGRRMI